MRRWTWLGAVIVAVAATLPLVLYAIGSAAPPEGKGRPAGPPAAIELAPQPLHITCDGSDASTLRVRLTDANGKPVADGTDVFFDVRYGFADPVETQTQHGDASTQVRLYPSAINAFPEPKVLVYVGDLQASINIGCGDGGGEPGCNPFSPPQSPASPPCPTETPFPTPCGGPSPPCPTPCDPGASPPCVTPTPCGEHPMSPPCAPATATATLTATRTSTPDPSDALYLLGLFGQTQLDNTVTLAVYILDLGGGPFVGAQWYVDYDEQNVDLLSMERASPAPAACNLKNDDGSRALLACFNPGGPSLDYFGDAWMLTFQCLTDGVFDYHLRPGDDATNVFDDLGNPTSVVTKDTQVGCGKDISTPAPSETPATPFPCTEGPGCITPTPTPLFQLGLSTTASNGVVTTELYIRNVGGDAYNPAQWHLDYPENLLDVVSIARAPGAPIDCDEDQDLGGSLIAFCADDQDFTFFGTTFIVTFNCLGEGSGVLSLTDDGAPTYVGANGMDSVPIDELTDSGPGWSCSGTAQ